MAVLQGMTWHFIQITWFLLVSHALRDTWSFWHQLIPHSPLEITLAFYFFSCFPLLSGGTYHTFARYTILKTAVHWYKFTGFLSLAPSHRPVQDIFKLCLILLHSNWKALISFNRSRMKPWLLTFFALPVSLEPALNKKRRGNCSSHTYPGQKTGLYASLPAIAGGSAILHK